MRAVDDGRANGGVHAAFTCNVGVCEMTKVAATLLPLSCLASSPIGPEYGRATVASKYPSLNNCAGRKYVVNIAAAAEARKYLGTRRNDKRERKREQGKQEETKI